VLDAIYGTLQDVTGGRHLREATHFADRMVIDGGTPAVGEPGTPEHHCSVVRSPLLAINPRQMYKFHSAQPKELTIDSCDLRSRW